MKHFLSIALCLLLVAGTASAKGKKRQAAAKPIADSAFVADYEALMDSLKVVGSNVVVVKNNKIVYSHCFGLKNREMGEELTPDAIFRIASISKSFTATSIMQLVEKGKLDLKADVNKYLDFPLRNPRFPDVPITLEMLMSHTSSLNDTQGYWTDFAPLNPATNPDGYAKCYNDYRPGTGYEYCNFAWNVMAAIIEKASGMRFDRYVVQNVMKPLGLKGSHCVDDLDSTRFVTLYAMENGAFVPQPQAYARPDVLDHYEMCKHTARLSAAGGVKITARDLAKYMLMHMNYGKSPLAKRRVMSEASARRMQTVITDDANAYVDKAEKERAGLGLVRAEEYTPGIELVGHTGGAYGLRSAMFFDPVKKYGFVVITNGSAGRQVLQRSLTLMHEHFIGPLPKK
ncbi:MAG: serine hydrolase domain-containing protein [Bacteroidales bacterium]|nr:serine hydrolase domain-containing protein [Bacteroidales bacterium]